MPWTNDEASHRHTAGHYNAEYRRNRETVLRRTNWRCEIRTPGICIGAASQCDHIVSVADGGSNAVSNLRAACRPCHAGRTARQGGRRSGQPAASADPPCQPRTAW
jgi:5-methylcytosine-specific restriction endonuclease McrA